LQQFLIGAVEEDEIAIVDGEDHVGMDLHARLDDTRR
jgi:hypothetical protein